MCVEKRGGGIQAEGNILQPPSMVKQLHGHFVATTYLELLSFVFCIMLTNASGKAKVLTILTALL